MRLFVCTVFSSGPASSADAVMGSASGEERFLPHDKGWRRLGQPQRAAVSIFGS